MSVGDTDALISRDTLGMYNVPGHTKHFGPIPNTKARLSQVYITYCPQETLEQLPRVDHVLGMIVSATVNELRRPRGRDFSQTDPKKLKYFERAHLFQNVNDPILG